MSDKLEKCERALLTIIEDSNEVLDGFVEYSDVIRIRNLAQEALSYKESENKKENSIKKYNFTVKDYNYKLNSHEGTIYADNKEDAEREIGKRYADKFGVFQSSLDIQIEQDEDWMHIKR